MTPTRREIRDLLEDAGARPAPAPDATFVSGLEDRLLAVAGTSTPTALAPRARSRARLVPTLVAAAAAAAVVLVGGLTGWFEDDQARRPVRLAASTDTVVELPNGAQVRGRDGLTLPDGAIVRTGPDGHAEVGNVDLGPGQEAIVEDGRIKITEVTLPTIPAATLPAVTAPTVPGLP